jgi:hypothetical protein
MVLVSSYCKTCGSPIFVKVTDGGDTTAGYPLADTPNATRTCPIACDFYDAADK